MGAADRNRFFCAAENRMMICVGLAMGSGRNRMIERHPTIYPAAWWCCAKKCCEVSPALSPRLYLLTVQTSLGVSGMRCPGKCAPYPLIKSNLWRADLVHWDACPSVSGPTAAAIADDGMQTREWDAAQGWPFECNGQNDAFWLVVVAFLYVGRHPAVVIPTC